MKRTPLTRKRPLKATKPAKGTNTAPKHGKARTPLKAKPRKASEREFKRCYHSKERVLWIKGLPCRACGGYGSENAHAPNPDSGMGYKGPYTAILPLCGGPHGCHATLHRIGIKSFERGAKIDLRVEAAKTQLAWEAYAGDIG